MPPRKKTYKKKSTTAKRSFRLSKYHIVGYATIILLAVIFHYRDGISYLAKDWYYSIFHNEKVKSTLHDVRTIEILDKHNQHLFGFDVSHYQNEINWRGIDSLYQKFPLDFVFIRSTMGGNGVDKNFKQNWKYAKVRLLVRGAYHYYRPDENSTLQAQNFIRNTPLTVGDFVPVLDIEDYPKHQSIEDLQKGVKNWLNIVEKHYGVKPIIYSGENFYNQNLKAHFPEYKIWIAKYSAFSDKIKDDWHFWQFTDKGSVEGIIGDVDLNIFNGNRHDLKVFLIDR